METMTFTIRWSRIKDEDGAVWVACSFRYNEAMVRLFKLIPSRQRRWIPDLKVWLVAGEVFDAFSDQLHEGAEKVPGLALEMKRDPALGRVVVERLWPKKAEPCDVCERFGKASCSSHGVWRDGFARPACTVCDTLDRKLCPRHGGGSAGPTFRGFADFIRGRRVHFVGVDPGVPFTPRPAPPARRGKLPSREDYALLGVQPDCGVDEVKRAHRQLALQHHPDRGGDGQKLAAINVARDRVLLALGAS